ncbi:MAG: hypothetical protein ABIW17_09490 [Marmoricola sp.]
MGDTPVTACHSGCELGVAEGREHCDDPGDQEGDGDGRAGVGLGLDTGQHEDAGPDDDADPEAHQVPGIELLGEAAAALAALVVLVMPV